MRTSLALATALVASSLLVPAAAHAQFQGTPLATGPDTITATPNVKEVGRVPFTGGTELDFDGRYVYGGQMNGEDNRDQFPEQGGVNIFDMASGKPVQVGQIPCAGNDQDVTLVRPGLVAVAHHSGLCNPRRGTNKNSKVDNNGVYLADVSDPANPVVLGGVGSRAGGTQTLSAHTVTVHPGKEYLYINPGGLANGAGVTTIVDIRNPAEPVVAGTFKTDEIGCHDLQFVSDQRGDFAFCAGLQKVEVWDVKNPVKPVLVTTTRNPAIQFAHNAVVSPDGKLLVVNDEAFAAHECASGRSVYGSLWIYDITDPRNPLPAGKVDPPAGATPLAHSTLDLVGVDGRTVGPAGGWTRSWCAAHNYNFVPGTRILVSSWFTAGMTVDDITDPLRPVRLASRKVGRSILYTAAFHQGRIYLNDMYRGLEVVTVDGLTERAPGAAPTPAERLATRMRRGMKAPSRPFPRWADLPRRGTEFALPTAENSAFCVLPRAQLGALRRAAGTA